MMYAALFDMDGTMTDNMAFHLRAWKLFCERYGLQVSESEIRQQFGHTNREHFEHFFGRQVNEAEAYRLGEEKEEIYREIFQHELKPVEGLIHLLESLKSRNFRLAVATSAPRSNVGFVLDNLGVRNWFDALIDAEDVSRGKPDPEVFLKAAQRLNMNPAQCLVFEDSRYGIQAALAAGMKVVALTTTHQADYLTGAHRIIGNFSEISPETVAALIES